MSPSASSSNSNMDGQRNRVRESKAWTGMMMASMSDDSDSDESDDERLRPAPSSRRPSASASSGISPSDSGASGGNSSRASWSQRAAAVGSRPPDTASQNPPTLKLLNLKSMKDGGPPIGSTYEPAPVSPAVSMRHQIERRQQEESRKREQTLLVERQREAARNRSPSPVPGHSSSSPQKSSHDHLLVKSTTNYGDDVGRHGSMINFGGTDGFGSSTSAAVPIARGFELRDEQPTTRQMRPPMHTLPPPKNPYEDQPLTPRTQLTQELGLSNPQARAHSPSAQSRTTASNSSPTRSLISPSSSSSSASPPHSRPVQTGGMPRALVAGPGSAGRAANDNSVPLQRGPPPPALNMSTNDQRLGPPPPQPIALPSPTYPKAMPEPRVAAYDTLTQGRAAATNGGGGGFSDASPANMPTRRPSLFRRSKAFLLGGEQGRPRQGGGMPNGPGQAQRRSLFRRSMALLSGRGPAPPPQAQQQQPHDPAYDDDSNAPAPRVRGFVDEMPKDRRSIYMGGSGMGDEWDFQGYGAKFWKRFSVAQRKLQEGEFADAERVRIKTQKRRKWTMIISLLGGVIIIAAVVAIVIWRENVKASYLPGALDREHNGAGTDLDQQMSSSSAAAAAAASAAAGTASIGTGGAATAAAVAGAATATATTTRTRKHRNNNGNGNRRKRHESDVIAAMIRRQVEGSQPPSMPMLPVETVLPRSLRPSSNRHGNKRDRQSMAQAVAATYA